jgi:ATP-dependent Lhr-like helicase
MGVVAWVGRGALGRDDGRVALYRPAHEALRPAPPTAVPADRPAGERHAAIRAFLASRGASFYREIHRAAGGGPDRDVLDALWDLVWAGEVTNDTFAPLRALRWKRPARRDPRPRPGRLTSLGPPEGAGRWSLVVDAAGPAPGPGREVPAAHATSAATERAHALATALLERHGIVTREAVAAEGVEGGFAAAYPILRAMEEAGRIRRGYFVDGLGAAQFALAGAIERLRAVREAVPGEPRVHLLAAADPANPYGAALAWPRRDADERRTPIRVAGAYVVLVDGRPVVFVERGGGLLTLPAASDPDVAAPAIKALGALVVDGRSRELVVTKVDGEAVTSSRWRGPLLDAGFVAGYRGLALRPAAARPAARPGAR